MHLIVSFAAPLAEAGRAAAAGLVLPHLQGLMQTLREGHRDTADEWSLSPPHERALAHALGWQGASGLLPWATRWAQADGIETGKAAFGMLTPAHWHLGTDHVTLIDPAVLQLDEKASRALLEVVGDLFTSQGYALHYGAPLRWYLSHASLATLATPSLDRVIGRNVDAWLGSDPALRAVRRLQSEAQMLLHEHPLNLAREVQGLLPVNSFWLSGCGVAQGVAAPEPSVDDRFRAPALAGDWAAWAQAWQALDEGPLAALQAAAQRGEPIRLTLCGERSAATFEPAAQGLLPRLRGFWSKPAAWSVLGTL